MPSGLFKPQADGWVVSLEKPPPEIANYHRDQAKLLVRYMFLMTPDEQRKLLAALPPVGGGSGSPAPPAKGQTASTPSTTQKVSRHDERRTGSKRKRVELTKLERPGPVDARLAVAHRRGFSSP
jgi:hypothetical protein